MPWYTDGPLLAYLEYVDTSEHIEGRPLRLPVQYVIRPLRHEYHDYRSYAGTIADGSVRVGQDVEILPSGKVSQIVAIETPDGEAQEASNGMAISVRLADDFDVSRGDMISASGDAPRTTQTFDATVCWMSDSARLTQGSMLRIKHTTRTAKAMITGLDCQIDINTLSAVPGCTSLGLNDIGRGRSAPALRLCATTTHTTGRPAASS
jgi:bifunctional enzyme CysN/CysC